MSKEKYKEEVTRELRRLNAEIDWKIVRGLSYRQESKRHKMLLNQLKTVTGKRWIESPFDFLLSLYK